MDNLIQIIEIIALLTGVPYIILEVLQKDSMWYFGIATGIACAVSFAVQNLWASMGLNIYYVGMSIWGLYQWKKDEAKLTVAKNEHRNDDSKKGIHLTSINVRTVIWSAVLFIVGTAVLIATLRLLHDKESSMDAVITVMSAIAMFWLGKSYPQHWLIWIVSDCLLTALCFRSGMYWMTALYGAYIISAVIGFFHWRRNGEYVS